MQFNSSGSVQNLSHFARGSQHVNARLQAFYTPNGLRPDGASDWNLQFSFTFLFPENKK